MFMEFTYNHVFHLNSYMKEKDLPYRVNFKDEKTMGLEGLGICACTGKDDLAQEAVKEFFENEGIDIIFSDDGLTFEIA